MEKILANIDGDSICYICSKDTLEESIKNVDLLMETILDRTGSTHYYLFLSKGPYFRHTVNKEYKGKRKSSPLKYLKTLKSYLIEQYNGEFFKNVEADDMVAHVAWLYETKAKFTEFNKVYTCSIDKDVRKQVPGVHFNYKDHKFSNCTTSEANYFLYLQTLMGDSTDNITGIPGIGEKKAAGILKDVPVHLHGMAVLKAYMEHYTHPTKAVFEFQKNFRQVCMLKTEKDFLDEVGYVPQLLDPNKLN